MTPASPDKQSGGLPDGHLARIVRLEATMDNVTTLQRIDALRGRVDELHLRTSDNIGDRRRRTDRYPAC